MGELHLEIIVDRLRREFKVDVNQGAPQVTYREDYYTATIDHREVYKKQSGGRGKFADILVKLNLKMIKRKSVLNLSIKLKVVTFQKNLFLQLKKDSKNQ